MMKVDKNEMFKVLESMYLVDHAYGYMFLFNNTIYGFVGSYVKMNLNIM